MCMIPSLPLRVLTRRPRGLRSDKLARYPTTPRSRVSLNAKPGHPRFLRTRYRTFTATFRLRPLAKLALIWSNAELKETGRKDYNSIMPFRLRTSSVGGTQEKQKPLKDLRIEAAMASLTLARRRRGTSRYNPKAVRSLERHLREARAGRNDW